MRLKRISLENIRSHVDTQVEFEPGITIFSGRTGSGKSTILMAIEYALFGSQSGISGKALLRRNARHGKIVLEFEESGTEFKVVRSLKRVGENVSYDSSESGVYCDDKKLTLMGRMQDVNKKILEILGYPSKVNPKELFEALCYAKQDEIRSLIEMKPEMRQQYIDRILQIEKYQMVYENSKDVLNYFKLKLESLMEKIKEIDKLEQELAELILKKGNIEKERNSALEELKRLASRKKMLEDEYSELKKKIENLEEKIRSYERNRARVDLLKRKIQQLEDELKQIKLIPVEKPDLDSIRKNLLEVSSKIKVLEAKKIELQNERNEINSLGGICPRCKQKVDEIHRIKLLKEIDEKIKEVNSEEQKKKGELKVLEEKYASAKKKQEEYEKYIVAAKLQAEKKNELEAMRKELSNIKIEEIDINKFNNLKRKFEEISEKRTKILSEISALNAKISELGRRLDDIESEIKSKEKRLEEARKEGKRAEELSKMLDLLSRLRDDIRKIREVVRLKFLEEFRQEFMRRFEEIRRYDEEYVVDIKENYEPIAYSGRQEVPISHLSGGEKTSVALAYRLALSKIAAEISNVRQAELLILDEPTTGFDREDIKVLPEVLRSLRGIPQIIIVTHEEILKEAADVLYEVKKDGFSRLQRIR